MRVAPPFLGGHWQGVIPMNEAIGFGPFGLYRGAYDFSFDWKYSGGSEDIIILKIQVLDGVKDVVLREETVQRKPRQIGDPGRLDRYSVRVGPKNIGEHRLAIEFLGRLR